MKTRRLSFTLVEMIVAMGVLSILTALLFSVLNETSRITSASMGRTRGTSELRLVVDQMLRELQSAVDDNSRRCFFGTSNATSVRIHFLATIDNNSGNEDAEVHYYYDVAEGRLYKDIEFWMQNGALNTNWDTEVTTWYTTPAYPTDYVAVLDNLKGFQVRYMTNDALNPRTNWTYTGNNSNLPGFVELTFIYCDVQDVIRYRGVNNVPNSLNRTNRAIVYLPRRV